MEKPLRILIADDSHPFFERLTELIAPLSDIEVAGYTKDVRGTLRRIAEIQPDAVFLDLHLPDGSGIDVLRIIKRAYPRTAVIVLTNFAYPQYRAQCIDLGADYFLDKSTEFEKVPRLILKLSKKLRMRSGSSHEGAKPKIVAASASKAHNGGVRGSTHD